MPDDEMEPESRAAERPTFFSDAVVAIAITLLAIELPVPEGGTVSEFWSSVRSDAGHYAAFLISFATTYGWVPWIIIPLAALPLAPPVRPPERVPAKVAAAHP